jgi:hypothetical protein
MSGFNPEAVLNSTVEILAMVKKSEAATWLARFGNPA